jgi:2,3-bisphosphoglycerate-dependent phosphoglycerate mutase
MREFSLQEGAVELLLVRHAEATPDPKATLEHSSYRDLPLNIRGRAQARALGTRLAKMKLATIYSSPLRRAAETAKAVSVATKRAIAYDERLREVEIGSLDEPRHPAEFGAHLDRLAELAIAHGGWSQIPGTEGSETIRERMRAAIEEIVDGHPGQRIAVVSHAGSLNAFLAYVIGLKADFFFPAANTSISVVRARGPKMLLVALNDVTHLHGLREHGAAARS